MNVGDLQSQFVESLIEYAGKSCGTRGGECGTVGGATTTEGDTVAGDCRSCAWATRTYEMGVADLGAGDTARTAGADGAMTGTTTGGGAMKMGGSVRKSRLGEAAGFGGGVGETARGRDTGGREVVESGGSVAGDDGRSTVERVVAEVDRKVIGDGGAGAGRGESGRGDGVYELNEATFELEGATTMTGSLLTTGGASSGIEASTGRGRGCSKVVKSCVPPFESRQDCRTS
jgi:hypothetical protein